MRRLAAAVVLVAGATACGTTVPVSQQALQPGGDGLSLPSATAPSSAPPVGGGPSSTTGGAPGSPGGVAGAPSGAPAQVVPSSGPLGTAAPGVPLGGSVVLGYVTHKDGEAAVAAVGISGASQGDTENQMRAVAAALNARGGILGRKVSLVAHDVKTLEQASNPDATDAATCADFKEKKVFAAVNVGVRPGLRACLKKAGIPIVSSISISSPSAIFGDELPGIYAPSAMSIDRSVTAVIDRLVARGFFTGWDPATGRPGALPVRIGMQSFDNADGKHVVDVTRKALAKHRLTLTDVEAHSTDVSANSASTSAAVLRFRSKGITHVIDANLIFFQTADSQQYKPRYVIQDTINTPALLAKNVGASQLHGSMGAGYLPLYEVDNPPLVSPEAARCREIMRKAGEDVTQAIAFALMLHACDAVFYLEKALTAGGSVSAAALRAGAVALGAVPSHLTYSSLVTTGRHDGASRIRDFDYVDSCTCFRHTSATTYAVP